MPELTPKQDRFCREYMVDLCATQAAIRAGYSEKTAYSQGGRLLRNVEVKAAIAELQEAAAERNANGWADAAIGRAAVGKPAPRGTDARGFPGPAGSVQRADAARPGR